MRRRRREGAAAAPSSRPAAAVAARGLWPGRCTHARALPAGIAASPTGRSPTATPVAPRWAPEGPATHASPLGPLGRSRARCTAPRASPMGVRTIRMASGSSTRRISVGSLLTCRLAGVHRCRLPLGACPVLTAFAHLRLRVTGDAGQPWLRSIWTSGVLSTRVGLWTVSPRGHPAKAAGGPRFPRVGGTVGGRGASPVCEVGPPTVPPKRGDGSLSPGAATLQRAPAACCSPASGVFPCRGVSAGGFAARGHPLARKKRPLPRPKAAGKGAGGLTPLCPEGKAGNAPGGWHRPSSALPTPVGRPARL